MQKPEHRNRDTIFLILHDLEVGCTLFGLDQDLSGVLDISRTLHKSHCQNKISLVMSEIDTHCHSFLVVATSLVTYAIPVWRFDTAPLLMNIYYRHLRNSPQTNPRDTLFCFINEKYPSIVIRIKY